MKDREARSDITVLTIFTRKLESEITRLTAEVTALRAAFDALFDVVADDLGYEAVRTKANSFFYMPESMRPKWSPREFKKTAPPSELVRKQANIRLFPKKDRT